VTRISDVSDPYVDRDLGLNRAASALRGVRELDNHHVDLVEALDVMDTYVRVPGRSDAGLAHAVQAEVDALVVDAAARGKALPAKPVTPAAGVDGGVYVRPIDAMLKLSRAMRPLISDDVYSWYRHWGWLRYLGIFDQQVTGSLGLSEAGLAVRANQRRVMSEDLGVGFGCVVAEEWCRQLGAGGPIAFVDVDLALTEGRPWLRHHGADPAVGDRQPDYLLVYPEPGSPRTFAYKALECKGTAWPVKVNGQLARAATQLASLELNGVPPQGIAVSTVSDESGVQYFAVDPEGDQGSQTVEVTDRDLAQAREPGDVTPTDDGAISIVAAQFIATSLLMAAGTLADYAGNNAAAAEFLPSPTLRRLSRGPQDRVVRETAEGVFRGVEYPFPAPGGTVLHVFLGVVDQVDDALASGEPDAVAAAQADYRADRRERLAQDTPGVVSATSDEGAILLLR
jgi:hypothetical protein